MPRGVSEDLVVDMYPSTDSTVCPSQSEWGLLVPTQPSTPQPLESTRGVYAYGKESTSTACEPEEVARAGVTPV